MSINNWYVITGSSCSGKTTLVNMLEQKGYKVVYETARTLLDQELSKGLTVEEIRKDENAFQKKILDMKLDVENNLDKQEETQLTLFTIPVHDNIRGPICYN